MRRSTLERVAGQAVVPLLVVVQLVVGQAVVPRLAVALPAVAQPVAERAHRTAACSAPLAATPA
jgi:hypothetical protein